VLTHTYSAVEAAMPTNSWCGGWQDSSTRNASGAAQLLSARSLQKDNMFVMPPAGPAAAAPAATAAAGASWWAMRPTDMDR
jgi:hypothetical protein